MILFRSMIILIRGGNIVNNHKNLGNFAIFEAFGEDSECPVCELVQKNQDRYIDLIYLEWVNDEDFRNRLKSEGFCKRHFSILYDKNDKLGLAIILSYMYSDTLENINGSMPDVNNKGFTSMITQKILGKQCTNIDIFSEPQDCIICNYNLSIEQSIIKEVLKLWSKNREFADLFSNSKGFCMHHSNLMISSAPKYLKTTQISNFVDILNSIQHQNLKRIEDELHWFIRKFDFRFRDEPWNGTEDSPKRAINKLMGYIIND